MTFSKEFAKELTTQLYLFVLFIQSYKSRKSVDSLTSSVENSDDAALKILTIFSEFEDVFSIEKRKVLASRKDANHAIELKEGQQSSYESLYNLSNFELVTLREYLDDALKREIIRHSISLVEASMLFVLKKNDKLRLCVDYRELNKITRKNRHLLSLITQMLNQLKEC